MKRSLFAVLVVTAMAAHAGAFWLVAGATCAEAHTGFAYARSLAEGRGFVLTPGAERCEGCSSLLWVLLLSFGAGHSLEPQTTAQAAGLLCTLACLVLVALLPSRLGGRDPEPADALPALLLGVSAPFAAAAAGGLDASLYTLLLLAALLRFAHEVGQARPLPLSAGILFLAALTRPEAALVGLLALPAVLWAHRNNSVASLEWASALMGLLAALQVWRVLYFGTAVPAAMRALGGALQGSEGDAWARLWSCLSGGWPTYLALLAAFGVCRLAAGSPAGLWMTGTLTACGLVAATAAHPTRSQALVPAIPFLVLGLREGLDRFVRFLYSPDPVKPGRDLPTLAAAVAGVFLLARLTVPALDDLSGPLPPEVARARVQLEQGRAFARLARAAGLSAATIASEEAAGLAWSSGLETIDLSGNSERTLAAFGGSPAVRDEYLLEQRRPTFIRLTGDGRRSRELVASPALAANYVRLPSLPGAGPHDVIHVRRDVLFAGASEPVEFTSGACFGGQIALEGLSRMNAVAAPGGQLELLLYWHAQSPDPGVHRIEVALAGPVRIARTHALGVGWLPAGNWRTGERLRERLVVDLPKTAREGSYQVVVSVLGPDGTPLGTTAPAGCEFQISARAARQRCLQLAEGVGASGGPANRVTTWHRVRQMELAGAWTAHEAERLHERACRDLERRGLLELETASIPLGRRTREAAACLMQARAWGGEAPELSERLAAALLERGRALAGSGDVRAASRELTLAARVEPTNLRILETRDGLWSRLAAQASRVVSVRPAPPQPALAGSPRREAVTVASAAPDGAVRQ